MPLWKDLTFSTAAAALPRATREIALCARNGRVHATGSSAAIFELCHANVREVWSAPGPSGRGEVKGRGKGLDSALPR